MNYRSKLPDSGKARTDADGKSERKPGIQPLKLLLRQRLSGLRRTFYLSYFTYGCDVILYLGLLTTLIALRSLLRTLGRHIPFKGDAVKPSAFAYLSLPLRTECLC